MYDNKYYKFQLKKIKNRQIWLYQEIRKFLTLPILVLRAISGNHKTNVEIQERSNELRSQRSRLSKSGNPSCKNRIFDQTISLTTRTGHCRIVIVNIKNAILFPQKIFSSWCEKR